MLFAITKLHVFLHFDYNKLSQYKDLLIQRIKNNFISIGNTFT